MKKTKKFDPDLLDFDDIDNDVIDLESDSEKSRRHHAQRFAKQMLARKKLEQLREDDELNRIIFGDYYSDFSHDETTL